MTFKLVSFNLCPYVQRSVITLEEKNVPYEVQYIDLADKPDWFLKISPFGKVPVLQVEDTVLFESAVINEYIDETTDGNMHPTDPLKKAYNRAWIEYASSFGVDSYMMMVGKTRDDVEASSKKANDKLIKVEEQLVGPYWNGDQFSLVDAAFAPMLQRVQWCLDIEPGLNTFEGLPKVQAYTKALLERESVTKSLLPDIVDIFREYLQGRGTPTRKEEPAWLGTVLAA